MLNLIKLYELCDQTCYTVKDCIILYDNLFCWCTLYMIYCIHILWILHTAYIKYINTEYYIVEHIFCVVYIVNGSLYRYEICEYEILISNVYIL